MPGFVPFVYTPSQEALSLQIKAGSKEQIQLDSIEQTEGMPF
jgi:hypothetical protein